MLNKKCKCMFYIMSVKKQGISPEDFYGGKNPRQEKIEAILKKYDKSENIEQPKFMTRLLGPSKTWKIFKKQQDAIDCCFIRRNGLMPFAFEDVNGRRMFLAAHPKVFWALNRNRFFNNCNSYEIIREYSACKLYLDLEYEYHYNSNRDGNKMLNNLLDIINFNLKEFFNINCSKNEALDLDSSSDTKFSHHVIYEIKNVAFQHNYALGNFIKRICGELKSIYQNNLAGDSLKLQEISNKYNLPQEDILELFIQDRKGQTKLFIDEGVYTKNRHFRLLGSSKQAKKIPLTISINNKYKPNSTSDLLEYFLDSLITYFSWNVDRVLEFENSASLIQNKCEKAPAVVSERIESHSNLQIDSFIEKLILPNGRIRRKVFFSDSSTIVYDIHGYRYCHNIGREHKSNNIKFIVDLGSFKFYQKCYDPDCSNFRSDMWNLPNEICFLFEDDSFFMSNIDELLDEDIVRAMEEMEVDNSFEQTMSDEELGKVADCAEAMLEVDW